MKHTTKNTLKPRLIALGLGLMLTTLCDGQSQGRNVIYWNGANNLPQLVSSAYDVIIVDFITPDQYCNLGDNGGLPSSIQTSIQLLHNAGKTVLVSFGGGNAPSAGYQACYYNLLEQGPLYSWVINQIQTIVNTNGFDGVDIDFEDNNGFNGAYDGVDFLTQLTTGLYEGLPPSRRIITHTPEDAYWADLFPGYATYAPYVLVWQKAGNDIAWFNLQTYNNCDGGTDSPQPNGIDCTAQQKILTYWAIVNTWGVPPTKLVLGVPVAYCGTVDDNNNCNGDGYLPIYTGIGNDMWAVIANLEAYFPNQFGGVMGWDYSLDLEYQSSNWGGDIEYLLSYFNGSANADLRADPSGTRPLLLPPHVGPSKYPVGQ